jgi:hypothetical protein
MIDQFCKQLTLDHGFILTRLFLKSTSNIKSIFFAQLAALPAQFNLYCTYFIGAVKSAFKIHKKCLNIIALVKIDQYTEKRRQSWK